MALHQNDLLWSKGENNQNQNWEFYQAEEAIQNGGKMFWNKNNLKGTKREAMVNKRNRRKK